MNLTTRKWIFAFGRVTVNIIDPIAHCMSSCKRWIIHAIDSASWWIFIVLMMAIFGGIAAVFRKFIGENTWIILLLDLVFCFFLFILLKKGPNFQLTNSRKKRYIIGATLLSFVAVVAATFGCFDHVLAVYNIYIFPILIGITFAFSMHLHLKKN